MAYFEVINSIGMNQTTERKIHQGRNVKRFREMLGIKQEGLALELGNDWNQKKISLLEQKEEIEAELLEQVAKVLKVPAEAIRNFDEQAAVNIITSSITNHDNSSVFGHYHFNPIDKVIQLYDEKIELYERMLKEKNELIEELKKIRH
jgi:transcriptional regulator with XRE-family HTH domain